MSIFLVIMANLLLLIGAGLFTKSVAAFERHRFNLLLGADLDDAGGDGPGSYDVRGNVWHLACCNPGNSFSGQGWGIFWSILGWSNNADSTPLFYLLFGSRGSCCALFNSRNYLVLRVLLDCGYSCLGCHEVQRGGFLLFNNYPRFKD